MTTTQQPTINVRPANDRGLTDIGWLYSRHSFSFGQYYDPANRGYRDLRVINDDIIAPGGGFGEHGHDNMEIISWMLGGSLRHGDNLGNMRELSHGEAQVMSAGSGIRHSEFNASNTTPAHLLQIWITPARRNVEPRYLQESFDAAGRANRWQALASGRGDKGALPIEQDATLYVAELADGHAIDAAVGENRYGYVHIGRGSVEVDGQTLSAGDAFTFTGPGAVTLTAAPSSEVLFFDLP